MKKLLTAGVVALGLIVSAQSVSAQSIAELQAMIAALQAQLAALAGQGTTTTSAYTHTVTLKVGSKGAQVTALQSALNSLGFNAGAADGIFGNGTKAAVVAFQASKGLVADGIVGPATGAALSAATVTNPGNGDSGSTSGTMSDEEADLSVEISSEDDLSRNTSGQHAFTFEVEADDQGGDAKIERVDLEFTITPSDASGAEDRIYKIIDAVTIEVDGDDVADRDTDSKKDWRELSSSYDNGKVRLSGLDTIVKSGDTVEFAVLLDIADLDDEDVEGTSQDLEIELTSVEVRYSDGAGIIATETGTDSASVNVELDAATSLDIKKNSDTPKDFTVDTSKNAQNNVTLAIFDVAVEGTDGILEDAEVTFAGTYTANTLKSVDLYVDGDKVDSIDFADITLGVAKFDMDEFEVEDGDDFEVEVKANFKKNSVAGETIQVTGLEITGEDDGENTISDDYTSSSAFAIVTITNGDIDIETVSFDITEPVGTGTEGDVVFNLEITNDTDSTNIDFGAWADYQFKIEGISGVSNETVTIVEDGASTGVVAPGETVEVKIAFEYTGVSSNKDLKITLEKIDGLAVFYDVDTDA